MVNEEDQRERTLLRVRGNCIYGAGQQLQVEWLKSFIVFSEDTHANVGVSIKHYSPTTYTFLDDSCHLTLVPQLSR